MKRFWLLFLAQLWLFPVHIQATVLFDSIMNQILKEKDEKLDKISRYDLETRVKDAISKASELLGLDNFEDSECEPDFSHFCPEGWTYSGDGIHCKANFDYEGSCERLLDFTNKTPLDKLEISKACGFRWPCRVKEYSVNGDHHCPQFWRYDGKDAWYICDYTNGEMDNHVDMFGDDLNEWIVEENEKSEVVEWKSLGQ